MNTQNQDMKDTNSRPEYFNEPSSLLYSPSKIGNGQNDSNTMLMDDLRSLSSSIGSFRTGFTPRVGPAFSLRTGLTPREQGNQHSSGFTPRGRSGFTPRNRTGFTPHSGFTPRSGYTPKRISTGLTPKDNSGEPLAFSKDAGMPPLPYDYGNVMKKEPMTSVDDVKKLSDDRRRMKNRERVRKCRKRKQDRLNYLESRNEELEQENNLLKSKISRIDSDGTVQDDGSNMKLTSMSFEALDGFKSVLNTGSHAIDATAPAIWDAEVQVVHGGNGIKTNGIDAIINHEKALLGVFSKYKIVSMEVQGQPKVTSASCKMTVSYKVEGTLNSKLNPVIEGMSSLAPFVQLPKYIGGETIRFEYTSHMTFRNGRITEDIRVLDTLGLLSNILSQQSNKDPTIIASITQAITSCRHQGVSLMA